MIFEENVSIWPKMLAFAHFTVIVPLLGRIWPNLACILRLSGCLRMPNFVKFEPCIRQIGNFFTMCNARPINLLISSKSIDISIFFWITFLLYLQKLCHIILSHSQIDVCVCRWVVGGISDHPTKLGIPTTFDLRFLDP